MTTRVIRSAIGLVATIVVVVAGARFLVTSFQPAAVPPSACLEVYAPDRCVLIASYAAKTLGVDPSRIRSIDIVPEITPPPGVMWTKGGATPIRLRVTTQDGSTNEIAICGGAVNDPDCLPILR